MAFVPHGAKHAAPSGVMGLQVMRQITFILALWGFFQPAWGQTYYPQWHRIGSEHRGIRSIRHGGGAIILENLDCHDEPLRLLQFVRTLRKGLYPRRLDDRLCPLYPQFGCP